VAGQVVVELTAADKVSGVLDRINGAAKRLDQGVRGATQKVRKSFAGIQGQAVKLQSVFVSLGAAAAVKGFAQAGIEADRTAKRLKFLGDQFGETAKLQEFSAEAAKRFTLGQTDAANAVADLFGRLRPMGVSMEDIETVFNGVNVAAKQMSLSTADVEGVMLQLSQALGSGKLQGDEFRSIMERLPKIGQAVAKSMGVTVGELKNLSSQGKLTTEEIIKALKGIEDQGFPEADGAAQFSKAMKDLATTIGQKLTPVIDPVLKMIAGLVNKFVELPEPVQAAVIGFTAVAGAFAIIGPLLPVIAGGLAAIVAVLTGPVGIVAAIAGVVAAFVAMKGSSEEAKEPMSQVNDEAGKTKAAIEAAARAKQEFVNKTEAHIRSLEQETSIIKQQEAAFENSLKVTDARLDAESAINDMQHKALEIAYEQAGSAGERLKIAREIFNNELQGAKIAFKQTLNSIKAEQQRLVFRKQAAVIEAKMIQAQGELAAAKEKDNEKAALILQKTQKAVQVQRENIGLIDDQIVSQSKIAGFQRQAAEAQLESARMTAEQNLKQRLVSKEIGMSQQGANRLTGSIGEGHTQSMNLEGSVRRVGDNARSTSHMFIQVSNNANNAANQITRAAIAQERLNRARVRQSSSRSSSTTRQAAEGAYWKGGFQAFARGGVVNGPTLGLVGEGGEPEYIIPQSKAAGFAANFLAGQRGAGAIPGFAEGGYATPNVNIQTGPVTQMDGTNYVTTQEMTKAVKAGVQQTLQVLRRDISVRGGLGLS
jgi:tape measure domain-containing protein|tara:strand:+ start:812 stop:3106 length:2295 start_codon:yes stop_codon:yes gene_type:complete